MPPLDLAPKSFYALRNSEEAEVLQNRAENRGEFFVYRIDGRNEQIFCPIDQDPVEAISAFCIQTGEIIPASLEYAPSIPKPSLRDTIKQSLGRLTTKLIREN